MAWVSALPRNHHEERTCPGESVLLNETWYECGPGPIPREPCNPARWTRPATGQGSTATPNPPEAIRMLAPEKLVPDGNRATDQSRKCNPAPGGGEEA